MADSHFPPEIALPAFDGPMDGESQTFGVGEWYHVPAGTDHAADFPDAGAEIEFWFDVG